MSVKEGIGQIHKTNPTGPVAFWFEVRYEIAGQLIQSCDRLHKTGGVSGTVANTMLKRGPRQCLENYRTILHK